jgi:PAS domain S-box-containing protein
MRSGQECAVAVPLRLLIVDSLPEPAEIVSHALENAGFALTSSVASDLDGCRCAIENGVDLVVADRDTVDLTALMVLMGPLSDPPPVVGLSTDDEEEVAGYCLRDGARAFLHKFRLHEIGDLVRGLMETGELRPAAWSENGWCQSRTVARPTRDLVAEISSDGRILYADPNVETSLGYVGEELTGRRAFEFVHPDDLPGILEFLQKAIDTGAPSQGVHRVRRREGSWCWLASTGKPYCTADGERRIVVSSREVADRLGNPRPEVLVEASAEPAIPAAIGAETDTSRPSPEETALETLLVVEEDDSLRSVVRETLEEDGYRVLEAASGEEALEKAAHHSGPIHLVLSDVEAPRIDGRELVRCLGASRPRTRVILMSGSARCEAGTLPYGLHPPARLTKPFTLASLRAKLREILDEDPDRRQSG